MRLVYVYWYGDSDERRYLFRCPLWRAWLLCRLMPDFDYAPFWFQGAND